VKEESKVDGDVILGVAGILIFVILCVTLGGVFGYKVGYHDQSVFWKTKIREGRVQDLVDLVSAEDNLMSVTKRFEGVGGVAPTTSH
jgi:hypothetical protein